MPEGVAGERIDSALVRVLGLSRSAIVRLIDDGDITSGGVPLGKSERVSAAQVIEVLLPETIEREAIPLTPLEGLEIIYNDDHIVVINKPVGCAAHPSPGWHGPTVVGALAAAGYTISTSGAAERAGIVHRLDVGTSGLMVVAKTDIAIAKLAKQFFDHTIQRRYRALVWGDVAEDEGTITGHVGRHTRHNKMFDVYEDGSYGKHAVTHYKVIERLGYVTLVECRLETGRTHQIRVHMQHIGHPLFNDKLYGGDRIVKGTIFTKYKEFIDNCFKLLPHQALHAFSLGFEHPTTGETVYLEAPMPEYFEATLAKWRKYTEGRLHKL